MRSKRSYSLPKKICILDIETEETDFVELSKSKIAIVGIKIFIKRRTLYKQDKYVVYYPNQISDLNDFLLKFPGIIIGHNIYKFDYGVLDSVLTLKGIIEKTVDVMAFLYIKNGQRARGLSLNSLGELNFKKGKLFDAKNISKLWKEGKHDLVLKYNERDCDLTEKCWFRLIKNKSIRIKYFDRIRRLDVMDQDIPYLIAQKPMFKYGTWKKLLSNKEPFMLSHRPFVEITAFGNTTFLYCSFCERIFSLGLWAYNKRSFICPGCMKKYDVNYIEGNGSHDYKSLKDAAVDGRLKYLIPGRFIKIATDYIFLKASQNENVKTECYHMKGDLHHGDIYWDKFPIK